MGLIQSQGGDVRYKANNDPEKADGPADGVVAPNTVPVENQGEGELLAEHQSGEEDQDKSSDVVEEL